MGEFDGIELFFLICAGVGSFFVLAKLVLQFLGGDVDSDIDADIDIDGAHSDSDVGFKILSLHSLSAFLMMFGLVGLALYRQSHLGFVVALLGGTLAGVASVWIIGKLFFWAGRLQSSGTLSTSAALGSSGTVYLTIPANGTGRVNVSIRGRLREFDAVSRDGLSLATGTAVKVVQVNANVLVVEALQ